MRPLLLLALTALSLPAAAASPIDRFAGDFDLASLEGTVEVPLLASPTGDLRPCVEVTIDDRSYVFALEVSHDFIIFNGGSVLSDLGLKARSSNRKAINFKGKDARWRLGGEIKTVTVESMKIGDLVLEDVHGVVADPQSKLEALRFAAAASPGGVQVDGVIGLGALEGVAWAILPSEGVVRFAPAEAGAALVQAVGGTTVTTTSAESRVIRFGKKKYLYPGASSIVPARIAGHEVQATPTFQSRNSVLNGDLGFPEDAPVRHEGDSYRYWVEVGVGDGPTFPTWTLASTDLALFSTVEEARLPVDGFVGASVMARFDLAVDPVAGQMALSPVEGPRKLRGSVAVVHASAKAALEKAAEEGGEAAATDEEGGEGQDGDANGYARVATSAGARGDFDGAIAGLEEAAAIDEDRCERWLALGKAQRKAGRLDEARSSFDKSAELYESWYGLPDDTRIAYVRRMNLDEGCPVRRALTSWAYASVPDDLIRQDASCHEVYGQIAALDLIEGRADEVSELYEDHLDLDPWLAVARGHVALADGDVAVAQEAYRQALLLEPEVLAEPRIGLAVLYAREGNLDQADELFEKAVAEDLKDPARWFLWYDVVRETRGQDAALELALERMNALPGYAAPLIALVREARIAGDDKVMGKARKRTEKLLEQQAAMFSWSVHPKGLEALYLAVAGESDAAAKLADEAHEGNANCWLSWLAKAEIARANGDAAAEAEALQHLLALRPFDAYAAIRLGELK